MKESHDFYLAFARAYWLGRTHPPHHPAVRVALAEAAALLEPDSGASAEVRSGLLLVNGEPAGRHARLLGAAFSRAGITRVRIPGDASVETLERLLDQLIPGRGAPRRREGARPDRTASGRMEPRPRPELPGAGAGAAGRNPTRDGVGPQPASLEGSVAAFAETPDPGRVEPIAAAARRLVSDADRIRLAEAVRFLVGASDLDRRDARLILAGRLARPDVLEGLIDVLARSSSPSDHAELARIGVGLGPIMADALTSRIGDIEDRTQRLRLLRCTVALGPVAFDAVRGMLADARWYVVRNGVRLLPDVGGRRAVGLLDGPAGHEDPRVRREVVRALTRVATAEASKLLVGMLDDADSSIRRATATALGRLWPGSCGPALLGRLQREADRDVELAIIEALGADVRERARPGPGQSPPIAPRSPWTNRAASMMKRTGERADPDPE